MRKTVAAWLAACLASALICAQAQADEATPVRTLAGITEYRLDNGLQVLLMPVAGSGRTFVTVTYKVGSRMEGPQEAGMAHLLEHVTFRGTRDAGGASIDVGAELKKLNVSYNGSTTTDRTNYTDNFSASDDLLKQVLALEAQRMSDVLRAESDIREEIDRLLKDGITPAELETARGQYLDARRRQTSSDAGLAGALLAGFDRHEGLAPLRARQDAALQALSVDSVNAAMRKLLLPDRWVVVITGAEAGADAAKAQ